MWAQRINDKEAEKDFQFLARRDVAKGTQIRVTSIQDVGQPSRAPALACVKQLREGVKVENNLNLRNLRKTCGQREPDFGSIISVTPAAPSLKDKTVLPSCEIYVVLTNRINDPPLI